MNEVSAAREEGIVRQVNEAIEDGLWPGEDAEIVRMKCECGRFDCNVFLAIRVADYERVRQDPRRFIVSPGHEREDVERVVETPSDEYCIVEKTGLAGEVAEDLDPRDAGESGARS